MQVIDTELFMQITARVVCEVNLVSNVIRPISVIINNFSIPFRAIFKNGQRKVNLQQ